MVKMDIDLKKLKAPWITEDGQLDLLKFPIDSILSQTVSADDEAFRNGCRMLSSMAHAGRVEVCVILYGLMNFYASNITRKAAVVEALEYAKTIETAEILFREMAEIESSNQTRLYIRTILKCLERFPLHLTQSGFEKLLQEKKWSYRMKRKFKSILKLDLNDDLSWNDDEY